MCGDPRGARRGIELDDDEPTAWVHHAAQLTQRREPVAHVADRRQADREIDRRVGERDRLAPGAQDLHAPSPLGVLAARIERDHGDAGMARRGGGRKRSGASADVEHAAGDREAWGKTIEEARVEVPERRALGAGVAARAATLERVAVEHAVQTATEPGCQRHAPSIRCVRSPAHTPTRTDDRVAPVRDPRLCLFVVALSVAACGDNAGSDIAAECNPLGGQGCLLPWPSAVYEVADSTTATGRRLQVPIEAMPKNLDAVAVDPETLNRWDGFSPTGPLLVAFPTGVSAEGLPTWKNPDASLGADSPIILVNADTGERAAFFAEIDQNTPEVDKRDLIIRPLERLASNAHYVVGIRKTVKAADGSELPLSPAFAAAVAGAGYSHPRFDTTRYEKIFSVLEAAGVAKSELAIAWDYHTASDDYLRRDLTVMRDTAITAIGANGANLSFTATAQPARAGLYKSFVGTFKSPNFLTNGEADESKLRRSADALPEQDGMRDARFAALIPDCVETQPLPRPTIIFGHGLFGSAEEYLDDDFVIDLARDHCFVIIAGDFIGLTSRQLSLAPLAANDLNKAYAISEKLAQSVVDFIALASVTRGPMRTAPELAYNSAPVIDASKTYYIGGSLGGTMGNVFMAYDPNITKGVLAVPGGVWSLLFERSNAWHLLKGAAQGAYEDPFSYQINLALLGMSFEPYDPITTAAHVIKDNLPGVPAKDILIWYAVGDCLVTNIATEMVGRTMGLPLLAPAAKDVWRMPPVAGPLASAITVYDEHPTPLPADTNVPPIKDNGTHSGVNRNPSALRQVEQFLLGDSVIQTCGGVSPAACDCATGACD